MRGAEIANEVFLNNGLTHSQTIMPAVEAALEGAGLTAKDIDLFACVVGPGSFTGVRIGVCAVKGLAHATGKPCVALNALETLAHAVYGYPGWICPMLDARRDQVYAATFTRGETPKRVLPDRALAISEFFDAIPDTAEELLFCGEAAPLHEGEIRDRFGRRATVAPSHLLHVRPAAAADLAWRKDKSEWLACERLVPLYLRAPSAERERKAREEKPR